MRRVTVAAFNARAEAGAVCRCLEDAGIPAVIRQDSGVEPWAGFDRPVAGYSLEVERADFEKALAVVYAWNAGDAAAWGGEQPWMGAGTRRNGDFAASAS